MILTAAVGPAHAYVDPGSGSVAVQAILAGVLGAMLALKLYWRKIVNLFRRADKPEKENEP